HLRQILLVALCVLVFFFTVNAPTRIYTLSLHDALPIWAGDDRAGRLHRDREQAGYGQGRRHRGLADRSSHDLVLVSRLPPAPLRSEEHTSELQSRGQLVCRLLLEKKKTREEWSRMYR